MKVYRLTPAMQVATRFSYYTNANGKYGRYGEDILQVGEMRKLPDNDPKFVETLTGAGNKVKKKYTKEIEDYLNSLGMDFDITLCATCGGKKKFVEYNKIEIVDMDDNEVEVI